MSIYVSITRRAEPLDENGPSITKAEWLRWAERQPDFRVGGPDESSSQDATPYVWTGHPSAVPFTFVWVDGQVDVKAPDRMTIQRMKAIAASLAATVMSETGEVFDDLGESAGFLPGYP